MPEGDARTATPPIAGLLAVFLAMLLTGTALAAAFVPGPFVPAEDADRSAAALALRDAVATVVAAEGARGLSGPPWKEEAAEYMGAAISQAFDALQPVVARAAAADVALLCRAHSRLSATVARDYRLPGWAKAECARVRGTKVADRVVPVRELGAYLAGAVPGPKPEAGVTGTPGTRSRARDGGEMEQGVTGAGATGSYVSERAPGTRATPAGSGWFLSDPAVSLDPGEPVRVARDALTLDALHRLHGPDMSWPKDTKSGWWALDPSKCEGYRSGSAALPAAAGTLKAGMRPGEVGSPLCFAATRPEPGGRAYAGTLYVRTAGRSTLVLFHGPDKAPSSPAESFHPHEGLRVVARGFAEALDCGGPGTGDRTSDCRAVAEVAKAPGRRGER